MLQRTIGVIVGGIVTFLLLLLFNGPDGPRIVSDATQGYLVAAALGALASWAWPVVIGWWLARRHRAKQEQRVSDEVERQVNEEKAKMKGQGF